MSTPIRRLSGPAAVLLLGACFRYVPIGTAPAPGSEVRMRLSSFGTTELARYLGPRVVVVEGAVVDRADGAVRLSVATVRTVGGAQQLWRGEQAVVFPIAAVEGMQQRAISHTRTALFTGGFVLAVAIAGYQAVQHGGGGTVSGGGGGHGNTP